MNRPIKFKAPTEAQKEAGNYSKKHVSIGGMQIAIENPCGSVRSGKDNRGKEWRVVMKHDYGYFNRSEGKDGDHVDVYIKKGTPKDWQGTVFVINQTKPNSKTFDEHKVIFGANSIREARVVYLDNYQRGWKRCGEIIPMLFSDFKEWCLDKKQTGKKAVELQGGVERIIEFKAESQRMKLTDEPMEGYISPKLDGIYAEVDKDGMRTKTGVPITGQPHIRERMNDYFTRNPESSVRGELYKHGMPFEDIQGSYQTGKKKLDLHLHPRQEIERIKGIKQIREQLADTPEMASDLHQKALDDGYEGTVTRTPNGLFKRKPFEDAEFPVTGVGDRTITVNRDGQAQSLLKPNTPVQVGDSMTVRWNKLTKNGNLRNPVAKGVRNQEY